MTWILWINAQRRAADIEHRHNDLAQRWHDLTAQRRELAQDNQLRHRVRNFAQRVLAVMDDLNFDQKQALIRLVVDELQVTGWQVRIHLRIPLDEPPKDPPPSGQVGLNRGHDPVLCGGWR